MDNYLQYVRWNVSMGIKNRTPNGYVSIPMNNWDMAALLPAGAPKTHAEIDKVRAFILAEIGKTWRCEVCYAGHGIYLVVYYR